MGKLLDDPSDDQTGWRHVWLEVGRYDYKLQSVVSSA
jgi:hypothetical protein